MLEKVNSFGETIKDKRPVFGIDLGTTNSAISVIAEGTSPTTIQLSNGRYTMPSCVMYRNGEVIVGAEAYANRDRECAVYSVKRVIQDPQAVVTVKDNGTVRKFTPAEISAEILKGLVQQAGDLYGEIKDVVVTVPAYFDQNGVNATREACELAGLNLIGIANEPTAASLCYHLEPEEGGSKDVIVYDLGGGTFDVTLMRIIDGQEDDISDIYGFATEQKEESKHSVITLGISGDAKLGGDDVDKELLKIAFRKMQAIGINTDNFVNTYVESLILKLEACKKGGVDGSYIVHVNTVDKNGNPVKGDITIGPDDFRQATMVIFEKTRKILNKLLNKVPNTAKSIVLVGGSTKNMYLREAIRLAYPSFTIDDALSPDLAVSQGAAIQGKVVKFGDLNTQIFDILPMTIGILEEGRVVPFISEGTSLPVVKTLPFSPRKDNQEAISVNLYQGNSTYKEECVPLGALLIDGLPKRKAEDVHIQVAVSISADRLLTCRVNVDNQTRELKLNLSGESSAKGLSKKEKTIKRLLRATQHVKPEKREQLNKMINSLDDGVTLDEINEFIKNNRAEDILC